MQLEEKYELLEAVGEISGRDRTIPAWEKSTGKQVFVHLLAGGYSAENNLVLTAVGRLSAEHRQHVLGAGDHLGNAYVITDALPWGVPLRNWIEKIRGQAEAPAPAPAASNAVLDESKLARAGTWRIPAFNPVSKLEPAEPQPREHTPPSPPKLDPDVIETAAMERPGQDLPAAAPEKEPGEFTRLLRTGGAELPAAPKTPVPAPSGSPASEGEFTRLMRTGKPDPLATAEMPGSALATPVASDTQPGEFTQLLRGLKPASAPTPAAPAQPATTPQATPRRADEIITPIQAPAKPNTPFGQASAPAESPWQFDIPSAPAPPPVQPAAQRGQGQGAFTQMFQGQPEPPRAPSPGLGAPPPVPQAEGEFTRMMRTPTSPAGGVFAPPVRSGPADADLFAKPGQAVPGAKGEPSFTQVINARNPAPPAAAASTPAPKEAAPAKSQPPYLILILVLGLVAVLMIALILILWLGRH